MSTLLEFETLPNTRDLGGMTAADGRAIKPGMLIRSGGLHKANEADLDKLADMLDTVVDFRTTLEQGEKPDPQLEGVTYRHIPLLNNLTAGITREIESDQAAMRMLLADSSKARAYMCQTYRMFATDKTALSQYRRFIEVLQEPREKALLWHCTAGKDRAGVAAVFVQELLGVPREAIREDYRRTTAYLLPEMKRLVALLHAKTGQVNPEVDTAVRFFFEACDEYLDSLYFAIGECYGGIEQFFADALGVTPEVRAQLQERYLD